MEISVETIGFPRVGEARQLKYALEKYWRQQISLEELLNTANSVEEQNWRVQLAAGVDRIGVGDFTLYDHMLDWTMRLGCEPSRFKSIEDDTDRYFAMARGRTGIPAMDMTKWFDTNYHYEVPEIDQDCSPRANFTSFLEEITRAIDALGSQRAVPIVIGPLTYVGLSKLKNVSLSDIVKKLTNVYVELFEHIMKLGVTEVQVHEPILVTSKGLGMLEMIAALYGGDGTRGVLTADDRLAVDLVTYFDGLDERVYRAVCGSNVAAVSMDFTRGDNIAMLETSGFPADKRLGLGAVDGRSIWKFHPDELTQFLKRVDGCFRSGKIPSKISLQPSCSLHHLPYTVEAEVSLKQNEELGLAPVLSFAYEKLSELTAVREGLSKLESSASSDVFCEVRESWEGFYRLNPKKQPVWDRITSITASDLSRPEQFSDRRPKQMTDCHILPTTTIGSFPQTDEIRRLRRRFISGTISKSDYETEIDKQIAYNIGVQEALGIDILVHGEPERTDMVEYFAQKLDGFAFTQNGWVQSYGSRCVRPPIVYSDLTRLHDMTVREFVVAQSLTHKPVKGMLTGPVTILNWSFPRKDISRKDQALQIALCLRDEVSDLERAGCRVVQMDEPALREGMPLKDHKKDVYLQWAVDAFKLSTAVAKAETSVHTHMCYAEFTDCLDAIMALDADVNSIENARSGNETLEAFKKAGYGKDLGPGTYDIHSPVVPAVTDIQQKLQEFLSCMPPEQLVVNPDCGLKTRKWPETIAALRNMVTATHQVKSQLKLEPTT
ncbi:hypothetical protein NDN08_004420 [Rhodosorus marinus]|uniref:5-methyltetrahydropteroyltriglutamate--homocysteine S-methyltransferase n=1 Tax=Rhodosorus marinus TaxID=101924 RepID=A0AAV8URT7_9RHOD|nr:hypothetical protein NDN08_004420 [Rhodosorus marinus]